MNLMAFKRGLRDGIAIAILSLFFIWTDSGCFGHQLVGSRVDLADEPDIIRTVCGDRDYSGIGVLC